VSGFVAPKGFNVVFDFTPESYSPQPGYNVVFDFTDTIFLSTDFYAGSTMFPDDGTIHLDMAAGGIGATSSFEISPWNINILEGASVLSFELELPNRDLILDSNYHGSRFDALEFKTFPVLWPKPNYEGATAQRNNVAWFVTYPSAKLEPQNGKEGAYVASQLSITIGVEASAFEGSTLDSSLNTRPSAQLSAPVLEGAAVDSDLETSPGEPISLTYNEGSSVTFSLQGQPRFIAPTQSGETSSLTIEFHPAAILVSDSYDGAIASTNLNTGTTISPAIDSGEIVTSALTLPIPPELSCNQYSGASVALSLSISTFFVALGGVGETTQTTLDTRPRIDLDFTGRTGESSVTSIAAAIQLPLNSTRTGETLHQFTLQNAPHIFAYTGETANVSLTSDAIFNFNISEGSRSFFTLDTRPSEGIGVQRGYEGAILEMDLQIARSRTLEVLFRHSTEIKTDFSNSGTSFDLTTDLCCGPRDRSGAILDLDRDGPPSTQYSGDKVIFTADLSTRARFSIDFKAGESLSLKDYDVYMTSAGADGASLTFHLETEYDIRLCNGNFIPHPDHVDVELLNLYDENCEIDPIYSGESMECDLAGSPNFQFSNNDGGVLSFTINVPEAWRFNMYTGETLKVIFTEISPRASEGAAMTCSLYQEPWIWAVGESMTLDKLVTEYDVAFAEVGCLDNEYLPLNEHGDVDWNKYNSVPVEMDRFEHELKAICF